MEGVDYAWARPSPTCLANSGIQFVVRYVGPDTSSGKWLRQTELNALRAAGLEICLVYQTTANFMLNGYAEGVQAGKRSLAMADGLGIRGRPFYHALDTDPRGLSSSQWNAVKAYLDGAASVTGRNRVGVYGGYKAIEVLVPTWAPWGWQTYAWSSGSRSAKAHLLQYSNNVTRCGGTVDLCRSLKADFGQWPAPAGVPEPTPTPAPAPLGKDEKFAYTLTHTNGLNYLVLVSGGKQVRVNGATVGDRIRAQDYYIGSVDHHFAGWLRSAYGPVIGLG